MNKSIFHVLLSLIYTRQMGIGCLSDKLLRNARDLQCHYDRNYCWGEKRVKRAHLFIIVIMKGATDKVQNIERVACIINAINIT